MKLAVLFAGQGQQFAGQGRDLAEKWACARVVYDVAASALGYNVLGLEEPEIHQTAFTQPAMVSLNHALFSILVENGFVPEWTAGLSLGEYNGLLAAGVLDFPECVALVEKRGAMMAGALVPGTTGMAAVLRTNLQMVEEVLARQEFAGKVAVCNVNTHEQIVIGGFLEELELASEVLRGLGVKRVVPLSVSTVSHTALLREAGEALRTELERVVFRKPNTVFVNNVEAKAQSEGFVESLTRQISEPTRMNESIRFMLAEGADTFVELGPKGSLSGFVRAIAKDVCPDKVIRILNAYDVPTLSQVLAQLGDLR